MFEQMKWEDVYELWRMCGYHFPKVLTEPVSAETVFVEYKQDGCYIYGYDWLEVTEAQERKHFPYFHSVSLKIRCKIRASYFAVLTVCSVRNKKYCPTVFGGA